MAICYQVAITLLPLHPQTVLYRYNEQGSCVSRISFGIKCCSINPHCAASSFGRLNCLLF